MAWSESSVRAILHAQRALAPPHPPRPPRPSIQELRRVCVLARALLGLVAVREPRRLASADNYGRLGGAGRGRGAGAAALGECERERGGARGAREGAGRATAPLGGRGGCLVGGLGALGGRGGGGADGELLFGDGEVEGWDEEKGGA
ncbi:MAG: hypothetical protein M1829_003696 [Trizodia sp. TS-e1964]|nr:MAG: hypothetical protein M1829_003696 [Trizodia sp. TS-e1964]